MIPRYLRCTPIAFLLLITFGCTQQAQHTPAYSPMPAAEKDTSATYLMDSISIDYLLGRFEPSEDSMFIKLSDPYASGAAEGAYLHRQTYEAFVRMHQAAEKDGISLTIISATRNFHRQKEIWEAKWMGWRKVGGKNLSLTHPNKTKRALKILQYSSMPGTSRHHWGTDIDLNSLSNAYFESGKGLAVYNWLHTHASTYGFCQVYSDKRKASRTGYEMEKWHWSYLPLALPYTQAYQKYVELDDIAGFKGAEIAIDLDVIQKYVLGIDEDCMQTAQ